MELEKKDQNKQLTLLDFPSKPVVADYCPRQTIKLKSNHFPLKFDFKNSQVYQYHLKIEPGIPEDSRQLRQKIIKCIALDVQDKLKCDIYWSGMLAFASNKIEDQMTFSAKYKSQDYGVALNFDAQINLEELTYDPKKTKVNKNPGIQFLNIFIKNILYKAKMIEIGQNAQFYYPYDVKKEMTCAVYGTPLDVWTGFKTSVDMYEGNQVKLMIDFNSRILRNDTMLEFLLNMYKNRKNKKMIEREIVGRSVLLSYGTWKVCKITGIDFKKDPRSLVDGTQLSFIDYYQKNYDIKIRDRKQPLLIAVQKGGQMNHKNPKQIFLVPELCRMTGLDKKSRNDTKLMNKIAKFTRLDPSTRYKHIQKLVKTIEENYKDNQWGIKITNGDPELEACEIAPPRIRIGKKQDVSIKNGTFNIRDELYEKGELRHWAIIYSSYSRDGYQRDKMGFALAEDLAYELRQVGKQFGIKVHKPQLIHWNPKNRRMKISKVIRDSVRRKKIVPKMLLILLDNKEQKQYKEVKEVTLKNLGILSQVVLKDTIRRRGNKHFDKSIISNILLQIHAKCGNSLWIVQRPKGLPKHTMLVGADVYHNTGKAKQSIVGFCATHNKYFTEYISIPHVQDMMGQELVYCMGKLMKKALKEYKKKEGCLPQLIVFFRDGVGESQIDAIMEVEVPGIKKAIQSFGEDYNPGFVEITVNKRIDDRFFSEKTTNPRPGTIISSSVVSDKHEYFLIAQNVTCGTVTGTKFQVICNNTTLTQDQFWDLTYKQCYNYYNWSGAVRVPAPCFYAHKLAYLIGETFSDLPQETINDKLYYL